MYRWVVIACLIAVLGLAGIALTASKRAAVDFTFNNSAEVNSLDPHIVSWTQDVRIANALFEGLMAYKVEPPAPGETLGRLALTPGVAERYDVSEDGRTYTFHLRADAKWSNGKPVTAEHFRWSWQRVMTPITAADYATMMFVIEGARDYYDALGRKEPRSFDTVGVKAPDDRTLVVTLVAPCGYFLDLTAYLPFFPVYPPLLQASPEKNMPVQNGITVYQDKWTDEARIVGNGPYVLKKRLFKQEMVLEANPVYWDREAVKAKRVRALSVEDAYASLNVYESRRCDWIASLPPDAVRALVAKGETERRKDFVRVPSFGTYYYRFNCQATMSVGGRIVKNPLGDPRVRRALALALDREDLVKVTGRKEPVARTFVPPGLTVSDRAGRTFTYERPAGLPFDLAAARRLLAEAGYPDGRGISPIRLMYNKSPTHEPLALRLGALWHDALGIQVEYEVKDANAFGAAVKQRQNKEWHVARSTWFGDYRDPTTFLDLLVTGDGNNDSGYSNPAYDRLMRAAAATDDQTRRMDLFRQAEDLGIVQEAAILPVFTYVDHFLIRPEVRGAWPNQMGYLVLKQVSVEREVPR